METVERLLTAGVVHVEVVDPDDERARFCLDAYFAELDDRVEGGFDPGLARSAGGDEVRPPRGALLVGRRLLAELETMAAAAGAPAVRLDTNRHLTEAIAMCRTSGYREVAAFNDERYADHWFEKSLR